jgi:hypothetical protein
VARRVGALGRALKCVRRSPLAACLAAALVLLLLAAGAGAWLWQQQVRKARPLVQRTLRHWQTGPDLAGLRDQDALARLPQDQAWGQLWADVADLLKRAHGPE